MSSSNVTRSRRFPLSSFLCFGSLAPHREEPAKPLNQPQRVAQQSGKLPGLPIQRYFQQLHDVTIMRGSPSCSFLKRLPLELRLHIYEYVLGGETINLVQIRKRSSEWPFLTSGSMLTSMIGASWDPMKPDPWKSPDINPALLLSCRQIYSEAADILYSSNVFAVDNITAFIYLAENYLSSQRLLAIKHLQVSFTWRFTSLLASYIAARDVDDGYYDFETWRRFWHLLANDMRLTSLSIDIDGLSQHEDLELDAEWVKPILEVRGIRHSSVTFMPAAQSVERFPGQADSFRRALVIATSKNLDVV